jgi:hypothetical protein
MIVEELNVSTEEARRLLLYFGSVKEAIEKYRG